MRRLLCLAALSSCVTAIFQDEAGVSDWRRENLGELSQVLHPAVKSGVQRSRVLVSSKSNVVASMDITSGKVLWRQVLGATETIDTMALRHKNLMTLSEGGKHLRMWNAQDGSLRWSDALYSSTPADTTPHTFDALFLGMDVGGGGGEVGDIAVVCDNTLQTRSAMGGDQLWTHEWAAKDGKLSQLILSGEGDGSHLYALSFVNETDGQAIVIKTFALPSMTLAAEERVSTPAGAGDLVPGAALLADGWLGSLTESGKLVLVHVDPGGAGAASAHLLELPAAVAGAVRVEALPLALHFMVVADKATAVFKLDVETDADTPALKPLHTFPGAGAAVAAALEVRDQTLRVVSAAVGAAGTEITVLTVSTDSTDHKVDRHKFSQPNTESAGGAVMLKPIITRKRDGQLAQRALLSTSDHAVHHLDFSDKAAGGAPSWTNEESLAQVEVAIFTDNAPLSAAQVAKSASAAGGFMQQVTQIRAKLEGADSAAAAAPRERATAGHSVRSDRFGFRKVVLAVTKAHKLYAMDVMAGGAIMWSHYFGAQIDSEVKISIVCLRTPSELASGHCVLVGKGEKSFLFGFDPSTGELIGEKQTFEKPIVHYSLLPPAVRTKDRMRLLSMVDSAHVSHVYPSTQDAAATYATFRNSFYFLVGADRTSVSGYETAAKVGGAATEPLWTLQLAEGEKWQTMASRHPDETVQSPVRVLGDRSIMYKHLNPNMLLIATTTAATREDQEPKMTIYLLDAVTGRVVSRTLHTDASGPVTAVLCENWAVYHYWSHEKGGRYEVGVLEFHDSSVSVLTVDKVWNVLNNGGARPDFSSFSSKRPQISQQSHVFQFPVTAMGVTRTRHGVTLRHVIMALESGQVYALDKRLVDPRAPRTKKPTQLHMEEGLLPYHGVTPIIPVRMLTYNFTLPRTKLIITEPATIESTCHVFTSGLDLFYTRTAPSGKFDLLSDDFSYMLLTLWVIGMGTMTFFAARASRAQDVANAWK